MPHEFRKGSERSDIAFLLLCRDRAADGDASAEEVSIFQFCIDSELPVAGLKSIRHCKTVSKAPGSVLIQVDVRLVAIAVGLDFDVDPFEQPGVVEPLASQVDPRIIDGIAFVE